MKKKELMEPNLGSGSSGSFLIAGSAGSGSETVRFPVPGSVLGLPVDWFAFLACFAFLTCFSGLFCFSPDELLGDRARSSMAPEPLVIRNHGYRRKFLVIVFSEHCFVTSEAPIGFPELSIFLLESEKCDLQFGSGPRPSNMQEI